MPDDKGHVEFVSDIHDARRRLGELIAGAPQAGHESPRMILDHEPLAEYGDLQTLVAATYHYRDMVAPVGDSTDAWSSELGELRVPVSGGESVEWAVRAYSLANLTQFRGVSVERSTPAPGRDRGHQTRRETAYLPPSVCRRVFLTLNQIIQQLNLGVRVDPPSASDDPLEPPEHVKEAAPAFAEGGDGDDT